MSPLRPDRSRSSHPRPDELPTDEELLLFHEGGHDLEGCWPVTDFATGVVPAVYEPRYAYPLILWLASPECPRDEVLDHLPAISPQNYLGLALDECGFEMPREASGLDAPVEFLQRLADIENRIVAAIRQFRQRVNVHPDRIFIAGTGQSASAALLIAMHQPEWFAGCICFGGWFPSAAELLARRQELAGRRFWLSCPGGRRRWTQDSAARHMTRQLVACGADVTARLDESPDLVPLSMLRDIDEWIISGIFAGKV